MPYIVGLTGGIGSGKSAAADRFAAAGIDQVDADLASRAVVEPGMPALDAIAAHFGSDILQPDGTLDRTQLRHRVFADPGERKWLQGLLHPLINRYIRERIETSTSPYTMLVNPLLIESGQHAWCDRILVIDVPREVQISRTMARDNNTREQVENILNAQANRETRLAAAHDVVVNDQNLGHLHTEVDKLHRIYLAVSEQGSGQNADRPERTGNS